MTLPLTDLENHRIEGYATHGNARIDLPLISEIEPGFFQGGCIDGVELPEGITRVLSLYKWEQYKLPKDCQIKTITMYDSADEPDLREVAELARQVNDWRDAGETVLVHCQAGLNRSGLIAAASLIQRGIPAGDAIQKLRTTRGEVVLCNPTFAAWLIGLEPGALDG